MVYLHLAEGFEEIEAVTVIDLLRRADIPVQAISVTGALSVAGAHNIAVVADLLYEDANYENCKMIVLPGGMPGTINLGNHQGLVKHIKCFAENQKYIAAICAAPMVLGKEGLLLEKEATIYPGMEEHLVGARHSSEAVVVDGNIITSKGPGTAIDFSLALIAILTDGETAERVRGKLIL